MNVAVVQYSGTVLFLGILLPVAIILQSQNVFLLASQGSCTSQFLSGRGKAKQVDLFGWYPFFLCLSSYHWLCYILGCALMNAFHQVFLAPPIRATCSDGLLLGLILDPVRA